MGVKVKIKEVSYKKIKAMKPQKPKSINGIIKITNQKFLLRRKIVLETLKNSKIFRLKFSLHLNAQ
jgi:hypothetical protein